MLALAYETPEKITTWYFDVAAFNIPALKGFFGTSAAYTAVAAERLVALKAPNGLYRLTQERAISNSQQFTGRDPFPLHVRLADRFSGYSLYTVPYLDAVELMREYEQNQRADGRRHRYPEDANAANVKLVSKLPQVFKSRKWDADALGGSEMRP